MLIEEKREVELCCNLSDADDHWEISSTSLHDRLTTQGEGEPKSISWRWECTAAIEIIWCRGERRGNCRKLTSGSPFDKLLEEQTIFEIF
ncbi:hypothetical protein TNCT_379271 [Trichonephila clavata]|uniref:Uncharacterized protein n=1 Tax=Trichonephila clavata TaxID=2740835 RepID=A0A8X6GLD3_TRICU|nr:hypothetical protein TNCT_379271 [Trichonephila clavata]